MSRKGMPNFRIGAKIDPNYNPYGTRFTHRQDEIILGVKHNSVRRNELSIIMRKAEINGYYEIAEQVYEMYEDVIIGKDYHDKYSLEEAKTGLQKLTPWKIKW